MTERVRTAEIVSAEDLGHKIAEAKARAAEIGRTRPFDVCMTPFGLTMQSGVRPDVSAVIDGLSELSEIGVTWSSIAMPCRDRSEYLANVDWFAREIIAVINR
jgi:hypothetical protein